MNAQVERLKRVIESSTGIFNIIVTQVDPDALGSAFAMLRIVEYLHKQGRIYFAGNISHPQNRTIVNKYGLRQKMKPIAELNVALEGNLYILVDSSKIQDSRLGALRGKIVPVIVIDHHRDSDVESTESNYVHIEDVGACCTLLIETMKAFSADIMAGQKNLATILAMGIYTDTKALASSGERDRDAYSYILQFSVIEEINALINYDLPNTFYKNLELALSCMVQEGGRLVTDIGFITATEGDDLSTIADLLLQKEDVNLVIVWAIIGNKVRISARSMTISLTLDQFLKERFGNTTGAKMAPDGHGEGGGIIELDLGFWVGQTNHEKIREMAALRISELTFEDK